LENDGAAIRENNRLVRAFLERKLAESEAARARFWQRDFSSAGAYARSVEKNRERFRFIIGVRDPRVPFDAPELCATLDAPALVARSDTHDVFAIRWPVLDGFWGEGLLLEPRRDKNVGTGAAPSQTIIHLPHAGVTPEQLPGLAPAADDSFFIPPGAGERMVIPVLVDRRETARPNCEAVLTGREYIYRAAYQMGRHIIGCEVQEVLALVDWLKRDPAHRIRVTGQGDGGLVALYAAAADPRVDEVVVVDYFDKRDRLCEEPVDRNVFGLLREFGDAEIASLIAPRRLTVVLYNAPELTLTSLRGGAPGVLKKQDPASVRAEAERARALVAPLGADWLEVRVEKKAAPAPVFRPAAPNAGAGARQRRVARGMENFTQALLRGSETTRREFWKKLDTSSPQKIAETIGWYRDYFSKTIVAGFDDALPPPNPRVEYLRETGDYTAHEVALDVFGGMKVFGLLLVPKNLKPGERRSLVICQHGLERGRKSHVRGEMIPGENAFASEICERGHVVFAPQGIFALGDEFRFLQRLANPLGHTLFSVMAAQWRQSLRWLQTLPFVDAGRTGLYGLSYGGAAAMHLAPVLDQIGVVVCSANFNRWNFKCANNLYRPAWSYLGGDEYEMFAFDLGSTFDHADMARLIAPRPFLVERGHTDIVAGSEHVGFEFGKVRHYYDHLLKLPGRTEIFWADGGHVPHGGKTHDFLDKWLARD
jgi:dienelactone hydrolase